MKRYKAKRNLMLARMCKTRAETHRKAAQNRVCITLLTKTQVEALWAREPNPQPEP